MINSVSARSTDYIQCSMGLSDYSQCIVDSYIDDRKDDVTFGIDNKYSYIFSQINTYLAYLYNHYIPSNNDDECVQESTEQILITLDEYITNNNSQSKIYTQFIFCTL